MSITIQLIYIFLNKMLLIIVSILYFILVITIENHLVSIDTIALYVRYEWVLISGWVVVVVYAMLDLASQTQDLQKEELIRKDTATRTRGWDKLLVKLDDQDDDNKMKLEYELSWEKNYLELEKRMIKEMIQNEMKEESAYFIAAVRSVSFQLLC